MPAVWQQVCADRARGGSEAVKRAGIINHTPVWVDERVHFHCAPPPPFDIQRHNLSGGRLFSRQWA